MANTCQDCDWYDGMNRLCDETDGHYDFAPDHPACEHFVLKERKKITNVRPEP